MRYVGSHGDVYSANTSKHWVVNQGILGECETSTSQIGEGIVPSKRSVRVNRYFMTCYDVIKDLWRRFLNGVWTTTFCFLYMRECHDP